MHIWGKKASVNAAVTSTYCIQVIKVNSRSKVIHSFQSKPGNNSNFAILHFQQDLPPLMSNTCHQTKHKSCFSNNLTCQKCSEQYPPRGFEIISQYADYANNKMHRNVTLMLVCHHTAVKTCLMLPYKQLIRTYCFSAHTHLLPIRQAIQYCFCAQALTYVILLSAHSYLQSLHHLHVPDGCIFDGRRSRSRRLSLQFKLQLLQAQHNCTYKLQLYLF